MNKLYTSKLLATTLLLTSLCITAMAADMKTTLKRGIFNKLLTVKAVSNGGYRDNCLKLNITNTSANTLAVTVDPALIFVPEDTNYQNLVTLGNETLTIASAATVSVDLHSYCGKSYAHSPMRNLNYKFWKQGDSNMVKTLKYVQTNNIGNQLAQSAVWMYTNGHCLSSVYNHTEPATSERLVKYIAELKKAKVPEMFAETEQSDRDGYPAILPNGQTKLYVPIKWKNEEVRHMYVTIYKENGDVYKKVLGNDEIDKNGHTVWVEFNSVNDLKGTYFVELKDNSNKVWQRKMVRVGYDPCQMM